MSRTAPAYIERRAEPRVPCNAPARVLHGPNLGLWADCVVRDLSPSGAKIELSQLYRLPPRFILIHFQAGIAYEVVLKWRRGDLAGMAFEHNHKLSEVTDQRLAPARDAWQALQPGFSAPRGPGMIG